MIEPPAVRPCGSCPYRRDVPSGVWDRVEYEKLPRFDGPTGEQDPAVFLCHQQDGRLCAGWVAVHDMPESLGLRLAVALGALSPEAADALTDYSTDVQLFATGAEAASHGLLEVESPSVPARETIGRISRKRSRRST